MRREEIIQTIAHPSAANVITPIISPRSCCSDRPDPVEEVPPGGDVAEDGVGRVGAGELVVGRGGRLADGLGLEVERRRAAESVI